MSRMKKGQPGHDEATKKWRETVTEKYGSVENFMAKVGSIGGKNGKGPDYKGGFAANRERARIAGKKGGTKSKRSSVNIDKIRANEWVIRESLAKKIPITVIAKQTGIPYQSLRHYIITHMNEEN